MQVLRTVDLSVSENYPKIDVFFVSPNSPLFQYLINNHTLMYS